MRKIVVGKDIYDKFGRIYITKGSSIDLDTRDLMKLERIGVLDDLLSEERRHNEIGNVEDDKGREYIRDSGKLFKEKHKIEDDELINNAVGCVQDLIFNSKELPWHLHLKTLANHVEWIYTHSVNTALLSAMIGIKFGYDNEMLNELVVGALLHDIGMVLIPKNILNKKDELTEEESNIICKHSELGSSMMDDVGISPISKSIILQHHERLDGSGYPYQIKDSEIIQQAQIVMIAEAFDTATSYRPYKPIKGSKEAYEEIIQNPQKYSQEAIKYFTEIIG